MVFVPVGGRRGSQRRSPVENGAGPEQDGAIDHLAVDLHRAFAALGRREHALRPVDLGVRRLQRLVDDGHLLRVDAKLGAEAEGAGEREVGQQPLVVVDGRRDARHRRGDARAARGDGDPRRGVDQPAVVARQVEIDGIVERAEHEALDTGRRGDGLHVMQAVRGLDQRQHLAVRWQYGAQRGHLLRSFRLGQHRPANAGLPEQVEVGREPCAGGVVDADDHAVARCRMRCEPRGHVRASSIFVAWRHRILQIQDDGVRARGQRLVEALGPVAGNEQVGDGQFHGDRRLE